MVNKDKQQYCRGCRNDFYNHRSEPGFDGATKCWSLKDAEVVQRYRIHWWTAMDTAANFTRVTTLDCHHEPGRFAFMPDLPQHLRHERHLVREVVTGVALGLCLMGLGWVGLAAF